jgi:phosphoribosyl 1,2-cyclic phosphate phosphodiesterase
MITHGTKKLLIDAGPDLRQQLLNCDARGLDGLLLTHAHNDHIAGIDDLRMIYMYDQRAIPLLSSRDTFENIAMRYAYIFGADLLAAGLVPRFDTQLLTNDWGNVEFLGLQIGVVTYEQAGMKVTGFRFGDIAYLSDLSVFSDEIFDYLDGVKTVVVSALRYTKSAFHLSVDEAIEFVERSKATNAWLTHIGHELDHEKTNAYLPEHIRVAYDGLEIPFNP